jgi:predicted  nucleic acid-binding Zn-ribbon protein
MRHDRTGIPPSCPHLDNVLGPVDEALRGLRDVERDIEAARRIHDDLRHAANEALARVEDLEAEVDRLKADLEYSEGRVRELEAGL